MNESKHNFSWWVTLHKLDLDTYCSYQGPCMSDDVTVGSSWNNLAFWINFIIVHSSEANVGYRIQDSFAGKVGDVRKATVNVLQTKLLIWTFILGRCAANNAPNSVVFCRKHNLALVKWNFEMLHHCLVVWGIVKCDPTDLKQSISLRMLRKE